MIFKTSYTSIVFRTAFLFITLSAASFLLVKQWYLYLALFAPILCYQLIAFFRFQKKTHDELSQFVESVHYRDFSRYFDVKQASPWISGVADCNRLFRVSASDDIGATEFMISCVITLKSFCQAFDSVSSSASLTF